MKIKAVEEKERGVLVVVKMHGRWGGDGSNNGGPHDGSRCLHLGHTQVKGNSNIFRTTFHDAYLDFSPTVNIFAHGFELYFSPERSLVIKN